MSQQAENLQSLGPIVVAQKVVGTNSNQLWMRRQRQQHPTPDAILERY